MTKMSVRLIAQTMPVIDSIPAGEGLIGYCARVSNPANQDNPDYPRLLNYCIRKQHWSVFQMSNVILEIKGPRDITRQFTRHESIIVVDHGEGEFQTVCDGIDLKAGGVQEFSQRYAAVVETTDRDIRYQDPVNRQNSLIEDRQHGDVLNKVMNGSINASLWSYQNLLEDGVAKECARVVLPEGAVMSTLYANATVRSWYHFVKTRTQDGVQLEHKQLAHRVQELMAGLYPSLDW